MQLKSGFPLWVQQFRSLLKKNFLVSWRNPTTSIVQLLAPFIFLFLIFLIKKSGEAGRHKPLLIRDPIPLVAPPIPPCEDKFFIKKPCFDFVWSGNSSAKLHNVVKAIMANNPGRPIPDSKVKSFATKTQVDSWLYSNPQVCPGALHFVEWNSTVISYGIQTNSTAVVKRGLSENPTFKFQIPLQIAAERELSRSLIGDPNFNWVMGFKEFAHSVATNHQGASLETAYPIFLLAMAMFGFVFQMSSLITEKELKLRQAMSMMGLYDSAYWLSWLVWDASMTLASAILTVAFGWMFRLDFLVKNNFLAVFLLFFLFQLNLTAYAYMLSTLITKSSSSTTVGFTVFIIGFMTQIITLSGIYTTSVKKKYRNLWSLFPPNLFARGIWLLIQNDPDSGPEGGSKSWKDLTKCTKGNSSCVMMMNDVYLWLVCTFLLWLVLATYFDNIFANASGVRKSLLYFLYPGYWTGNGGSAVKEGGICSCTGSLPAPDNVTPDDEDVLEEENNVKQQANQGVVDPNVAVQFRALAKTYPGTKKMDICCGCCRCERKDTPPYHAVKGLWANFAKDQLFCLLGPNGAGKTTAINCLTGITPVTGGDVFIYGNSVRTGMSNIRKIIGVCPQFDILWETLSCEDHLHLFASIKGIAPASVRSVADKLLAQVKLTASAKLRAGYCSGGMKRRLSIAIALIGDPKLIILDEPTTGMDPITRRHVWDIIDDAKKGRVIILTTHSMEEADVLSDRIGIMAKGRLRCIGTSIRLKSKFGTGFLAAVSFREGAATHLTTVKHFFKDRLNITPKEENKAFLTYIIPHDKEGLLTDFFEELQGKQNEYGIADIQLSLTTLEEVFLNIARQAELETALAEGRMVTLSLTTREGVSVEIPIGARFVGIPGTEGEENLRGIMVEVFWVQDDSGALCISGHSPELAVPEGVGALPSLPQAPGTKKLGRKAPVHGVVFDPDHIRQQDYTGSSS
ncbi:hypothetical protein ACFE04_024845 [Oxalis oulophora]